jgi:hypothetical protein
MAISFLLKKIYAISKTNQLRAMVTRSVLPVQIVCKAGNAIDLGGHRIEAGPRKENQFGE